MGKSRIWVCVVGGAGYIGSSLVKKLLDEGYTVHATLRNLNDKSKAGLLKSFAGADERLKLFEADLYKPEQFEQPIRGCQFVFLVATPTLQSEGFNQNNIVEATVDAAKNIANVCMRSGSVRRLIYTASVVAASPLQEDGSGFKGFVDETCWTPLHLSFSHCNNGDFLREYTECKTLAEKEILKIGNEGLEVVSLVCGLVGGNTHLSYSPTSVSMFFSQLTGDEILYKALKFLEDLVGKLPLVHVEDVCNAHIFAMEANGSMSGRFLCANSFVSSAEMAAYLHRNYPEFRVQ